MARDVRSARVTFAVAVFTVAFLPAHPPATAATPSPTAAILPDPPLPEGAVARIGLSALRVSIDSQLRFSPDGKVLLAVGSSSIHFWDMRTRRLLHEWAGTAAAFSPDGERVAIATRAAVHVYTWPPGRALHEFPRPEGTSQHLAFAPRGDLLASACPTSERVTLWNVVTGEMVREIPASGCESGIEFSPDGHLLATGSGRTGAGLYEVNTGRRIRGHPGGRTIRLAPNATFEELNHYYVALKCGRQARFSRDGTLLAQAGDELQFWDTETGLAKGSLNTGQQIRGFAFSPDGKAVAVGGARGRVEVWDLAGRKVKWACPTARTDTGDFGVAFSPDGKLVAACIGYWARLWEAETGIEAPREVRDRAHVGKVALSPDGRVLAAAIFPATGVRPPIDLFDAATGETIAPLDGDAGVIDDLKFSPDGRWLAAVNLHGKTQVWDVARRQSAGRFDLVRTHSYSLAFSPDSTRLAVANRRTQLHVWDLAGERMVRSLVPQGSPNVAFAPDGRTLITFSQQHFQFWDLATGNLRAAFHQGEEPIKGGVVINDWILSPDGWILATATRRGRLVFREAATGQTRLEMPMSGVKKLCFLSGRVLAVTAPDGPIALLDVRNGEVLHRLESHNATAEGLSASADGTRLVSRVWQQEALVWDTSRWAGRLSLPADGRTDEALWADLNGMDAAAAHQAVWGFVSRPDDAVDFLAARLTPNEVRAPDPFRLRQLIADLDDERFATREAASRALIGHGPAVEAAVRVSLGSESPEVRRRAEAILRRLRPPVTPAQARALEVLEHIGTAEAEALLRQLADGVEGAPLTETAELVLGRLRPTESR